MIAVAKSDTKTTFGPVSSLIKFSASLYSTVTFSPVDTKLVNAPYIASCEISSISNLLSGFRLFQRVVPSPILITLDVKSYPSSPGDSGVVELFH